MVGVLVSLASSWRRLGGKRVVPGGGTSTTKGSGRWQLGWEDGGLHIGSKRESGLVDTIQVHLTTLPSRFQGEQVDKMAASVQEIGRSVHAPAPFD